MPLVLNQTKGCIAIANALGLLDEQAEEDPVLISIDCEWGGFFPDEHHLHGKLTEIGLCILDTRDLRGVSPGLNAVNWVCKAHSKHYRMLDTVGVCSDELDKRGVALWAPDKFEFGESILIDREHLGEALEKDFRILGTLESDEEAPSTELKYRNVIMIAHGAGNESKWLKKAIGINLDSISSIRFIADTQKMHMSPSDSKPALHKLMEEFGIERLHLHNGANDATYTLMVLVIGALWRAAWESSEKGEWELMNAGFPMMRVRGEEVVQAMKGVMEAEVPFETEKNEWVKCIALREEQTGDRVVLELRAQ